MGDGVTFTLAQMEELHKNSSECEKAYGEAIKSLEEEVNGMTKFWTSAETGTYEEFKTLFDAKLPALKEADTLMQQFCAKIEERKNTYQEAANRTINMFQ